MTADSNDGSVAAPAERFRLWGPLTLLGLAVAVATAVVDQATKLWLIFPADLGGRARVTLTPFLDLVLTWNKGISYGLFPQEGPLGQWALLALKAIAGVLLWIWLARATSRLTAVSLGLIVGGAIGNAARGEFTVTHAPPKRFRESGTAFLAPRAGRGRHGTEENRNSAR